MDKEEYNDKVVIINKINQILQQIETKVSKLNELSIELEDKDIKLKHYNKLAKGISYISFFIINERKSLKQLRKKYYKKINGRD